MSANPIVRVRPLGFPWPTTDPFLFCVFHDDAYPRGNGRLGPDASLAGRDIGQDFSRKDGWSMYHGTHVPGFPAHPHRGFETVTIVREGLVDHADSLGAAARYGRGDVQWLTAGGGIVHAEMFPLLDSAGPNPLQLFQIWLNLPAASKMAAPHFTMFWSEDVPRRQMAESDGRGTEVVVVAGRLGDPSTGGTVAPLPPPPDSWASHDEADVAIWTIRMDSGARWTVPPATGAGTRRTLYFFSGGSLQIGGQQVPTGAAIEVRADMPVQIVNGQTPGELLLLQGRPICEPVAQYSTFVMNTQAEIMRAFDDYRRTQFGGWTWPDVAPVHGMDPARFARYPDGREDRPTPRRPAATPR
jgi:hypothetical protein